MKEWFYIISLITTNASGGIDTFNNEGIATLFAENTARENYVCILEDVLRKAKYLGFSEYNYSVSFYHIEENKKGE